MVQGFQCGDGKGGNPVLQDQLTPDRVVDKVIVHELPKCTDPVEGRGHRERWDGCANQGGERQHQTTRALQPTRDPPKHPQPDGQTCQGVRLCADSHPNADAHNYRQDCHRTERGSPSRVQGGQDRPAREEGNQRTWSAHMPMFRRLLAPKQNA